MESTIFIYSGGIRKKTYTIFRIIVTAIIITLCWPIFSSGYFSKMKFYLTKTQDVPDEIITAVKQAIENEYSATVELKEPIPDVEFAFDKTRKQYYAPQILLRLSEMFPGDAQRIILIVDKDLYDHGLNFIFGEAANTSCVVSMWRFKPCHWKALKEERDIIIERTIKTVIHELGHTFGLQHCPEHKCVMYFSNWLGDTDRKTKHSCQKCKKKLQK